MTDRIDQERKGAELLPFYVNGTLSPEERAEVEALLAEDDGLRRQLDFLTQIRAVMKAEELSYSPGELGLARLMGAIAPARNWMLPVAAAVGVVGIALAAVLYHRTTESMPAYEQAGGAAAGPLITVAFRPAAQQGEISDFLLANDVTIVDGPSAIGLYRILVPEAQSKDDILARFRAASSLVESAEIAE